MSLGKQWVKFAFGASQQERDGKYLRTGELIEAINVEQMPDGGPHVKRPGFDRQLPAFSGASWTGPAEALVCGDGSSILSRATDGRAWAYSTQTSTFYDRGVQPVFYPETEVALPAQLASPRPVMAFTNTQQWIFGVDVAGGAYYYTVKDLLGNTIQPQTRIAATGILQIAAAYDPNNAQVWAIWVANGTTATSHKFNVSTPGTAPTSATYQTVASATLQCVDMRYLSVPNEIAVVVSSFSTGANQAKFSHSYLDLGTGAAKSSPAAVTTTVSDNTNMCTCPHILLQDGTGGAWHYAIWTTNEAVGTDVRLRLINVTSSTLAVAADTLIASVTVSGAGARYLSTVSGYVETSTGDRVLYAQEPSSASALGGTKFANPRIHKYRWNGSSVTTTSNWMRGSWLATGWATRSSNYYALIGYDDSTDVESTGATRGLGVQRTLFLVDQDAKILARIGSGPGVLTSTGDAPITADSEMGLGHVSTFVSFNNVFYVTTATTTTSLTDISVSTVRFDIAGTTFATSQPFGEKAVAAGGIPIVWGKGDALHELGPLLSPAWVHPSAVGTANAACYRITDSDGTVWRSSPFLLASGGGAGATLKVPTLRHTLPNTVVEIEVYAGSGSPQLQGYLANDKTVDALTFTMPTPLRTDETLYTTGGALSNAPMFPARALITWRNRLFSAQGNNVRYSQEFAAGLGPQFNEALATVFTEGSGDILAFGVVDWNYLAVFKRDAIAVLSGTGPDGRAQGNYVVQVLTTKMGVSNLGSITSGPAGCFFQDSQTGRICCVTPSLQVLEAAPGLDDYAATAVTGAMHVESRRQIWFFGSNFINVIDYRHTTEAAPFGLCYRWNTTGTGTVGCVDNTGPVIQSTSQLWRPGVTYADNTVPFFMKLTTGDLFDAALQGEFAVSRVQFLGTWRASHDLKLTTYPDFSSTGTAVLKVMNAGPEQVVTRPPNCGRVQSLRVTIEEQNSTGRGFDFHGLAIEIQPRGRAKTLNVNQVI